MFQLPAHKTKALHLRASERGGDARAAEARWREYEAQSLPAVQDDEPPAYVRPVPESYKHPRWSVFCDAPAHWQSIQQAATLHELMADLVEQNERCGRAFSFEIEGVGRGQKATWALVYPGGRTVCGIAVRHGQKHPNAKERHRVQVRKANADKRERIAGGDE